MSDNVLTAKVTINGASYIITSEGKVFGAYGQSISIRPNTSGYASFTAGRKGRRINVMLHRLVAELFIPNPNNYSDVDHLDSNPMNPQKENLDWCSHPENVRRAYDRGHHIGKAVGEKNPRAHLTEEIVLQLRAEYRAGVTIQEMCDKYGYPWNTIGNAVKGYTWKHIPA